jgi:hypothetical protein
MSDERALSKIHPGGEGESVVERPATAASLDTFGGKPSVPFFIEFLKTSGLFDAWVNDCPLRYASPNAPSKRDVLGTILLSVLAGHWRYAHISVIRGDGVKPGLLGMTKVASEDSVRRALKGMDLEQSEAWLKKHLKASYEPLLAEPWALGASQQQHHVLGFVV